MFLTLNGEKASPNMNCECECETWAEFLLESEEALSDAEREGLASHLARCHDCAIEREIFLESWAALDDVEETLEPSPLLRAKVWEKIRQEGCCPKPLLPRLVESADRSWRGHVIKLTAAAAAIVLGFGLGRSLRSAPDAAHSALASEITSAEQFLDTDLIQLASQEGFSLDLFPESTQFTPIDREMMSVLAPSPESREWLSKDRGVVVPLQYISQGLPPQGRPAP